MEATQKLLFVALPLAVGAFVPQAWNRSKEEGAESHCAQEVAGLNLVLITQCLDAYKDESKCEDAKYAVIACSGKPQS